MDVYAKDHYSLKAGLYGTWETGTRVGLGFTAAMEVIVAWLSSTSRSTQPPSNTFVEFGTLKASGASNRDVYRIIVEQALLSAVLGYVDWLIEFRA